MEIKINGENFPVTDSLKEYVQLKFSRVAKPDSLQQAEFRFGKIGQSQIHVKFFAHVKPKDIVVDEKAETGKDVYSAIDRLMDRVQTQFVKLKETKQAARTKA